MNILSSGAHRLVRDDRGATIVEMGFVALPLCMILMALFDLGYSSYAKSMIEGTLERAARQATIGNKTPSEIDDYVKAQLQPFWTTADQITISKTNYYEFSGIGKSEKLTKDTNSNGVWDSGDCYEDLNEDNKWNSVAGRYGLGGADDIVYYTVKLTYPRLFPMDKMLGWSGSNTLTGTTLMRNQPYGSQLVPPIKGGTTESGECP